MKNLAEKEFVKGSILLHTGDAAKYAYKVVKGCLRSYITDEAGKEHIIQFAPENWLITDLNSFLNSVPAFLSIDAIEPTRVWLFDRRSLEQEMESLEKEEYLNQIRTLQRNVIAIQKRLALLLGAPSKERYLDFIETYPQLVNRVPLKFIATYIGVTPEYLSGIRRKLVKH